MIYLIGYVLAFFYGKFFWRKAFEGYAIDGTWAGLLVRLFMAIGSWLIIMVYTIGFLTIFIINLLDKVNFNKNKPPKWL
jgi:hypothetical protein